MKESLFRGLLNRILQELARILPGAQSVRVALHRARGVNIGRNVWIGYDVALETSRPFLITLEEGCVLSMRVTVLAHFKESTGVKIERDAFVGAGALILPNVVIGQGAVVAAGSVVTRSVPPLTMVQGNPAVPVAKCGIPLGRNTTLKEFTRHLRPATKHTTRPDKTG
jgi:acetyltransferase-like isoleucine patch superfamily enzyme